MKKTQIIDALRNIKKQKVSYISIVLIAFLAVTCFTGVSFASKGLTNGSSLYYDERNFRDFEIASSVMFSGEDLKEIAEVEGVADVEGVLRTSGKVLSGGSKTAVTVLSKTERINIPEVLSGELPTAADACAIEKKLADDLGLGIGDRITLEDAGSEMKLLKQLEFTVSAIVIHPDHIVTPNPFESYVIVGKEAFDTDQLGGRTIYAEVVIDKPAGIDRYEDEYFTTVDGVWKKLEKLSAECASATLLSVWTQLEEYKTLFRDVVFKPIVLAAIKNAKNCSDEEAQEIFDRFDWATDTESPDLNKDDLDAGRIPILSDFSFVLPEKDKIVRSLLDQLSAASDKFAQAGFELWKVNVPDETVEKLQAFVDGLDLSVYGKLTSAVTLFNRGLTRYRATVERLESGAPLAQDLGGVWLIFDARMNAGYMHMSMSANGLAAISLRFTLLFILVAAIVIYATVGKLVDEQKKLVGTTKAFGFYNREIFGKYLIFGGSATLLGTILGTLAGTFFLQFFVEYSYGRYYVFGTAPRTAIVWQIFVIPLAGLLLAFAAVWFAGAKLIRSPAVALMKDDVPAVKRKAKNGKKSRRSLYTRLILRNIRTDAKRVIVTIVSIAGCCALILIGFSIYLSVRNTIDVQFEEIIRYDSVVSVDLSADKNAAENIAAALEKEGASSLAAYTELGAFRSGNGMEPAEFIVADLSKLSDYIVLRDPKTDDAPAGDEGVILPSSYAETYDLSVGDECILIDSEGNAYIAKVGGIFENYLGRTVALGRNGYREIFGKEAPTDALLVKHPNVAREALAEKLKGTAGYETITRADDLRVVFNSYSDLLAIMMVLLIGAAGMMSAVILTNLVNICILQKKRELTVMRVNGFTTKEVKNYITREAFLTSALGVILGTLAGLLQFSAIMPALGKSYTAFIMTPNILGICLSAAITVFFTVVIYRLSLRKVKNLKLTDIA